jgi:hypothetical protein
MLIFPSHAAYVFGRLDVLADHISENLNLYITAGLVLTAAGASVMTVGGAALMITVTNVTVVGVSSMGAGVATVLTGGVSLSVGTSAATAAAAAGKGSVLAKLFVGVKSMTYMSSVNLVFVAAAGKVPLVLGGVASGLTGIGLLGASAFGYYRRSGSSPADDIPEVLERAPGLISLDSYVSHSSGASLSTMASQERAQGNQRRSSVLTALLSLQSLITASQAQVGEGSFGSVIMRQGGR